MKTLIKILISIKFKEVLDKNKDNKISWTEIKNASFDDWMTIAFEIIGRVEIVNLVRHAI